MMKFKKYIWLILCSTVLLVAGCGSGSDIGATAKPLKGGEVDGLGHDWQVICIDGVEYIARSHGLYSTTLTAHFKQDGSLFLCN